MDFSKFYKGRRIVVSFIGGGFVRGKVELANEDGISLYIELGDNEKALRYIPMSAIKMFGPVEYA